MTFSRNFLRQIAAPFIVVSAMILIFFAFWLPVPPLLAFWYGIAIIAIDIALLVKSILAMRTTNFDYTILYDSEHLIIEMPGKESHVYSRKTLHIGKGSKYFSLQDGETQHAYLYNDKVIAFLNQLE